MQTRYQAIVIGASAGGFKAVKQLLPGVDAELPAAVIIVQHLPNQPNDSMIALLGDVSPLPVKEAEDKEPIAPGVVYICPPNYHLLVDMERRFALSAEPKVNYSRPSIDVLFESAAEVYQQQLVGVVLTGANADGSVGLNQVKQCGGLAIVQDPADADYAAMPQAAMEGADVDMVVTLKELATTLNALFNPAESENG